MALDPSVDASLLQWVVFVFTAPSKGYTDDQQLFGEHIKSKSRYQDKYEEAVAGIVQN
jgi:hypothetical protein